MLKKHMDLNKGIVSLDYALEEYAFSKIRAKDRKKLKQLKLIED